MATTASKSGIIPELQQVLWGAIATLLLAPLAGPCAIGADAEAGDTGGLQEIIVTAQRTTENYQSVPISMAVLTGDDIRSLSSSTFTQVSEFVPNVEFTGVTGGNIFIRGIGQTSGANSNDPGVGFYVDGVYIAHQWGIDTSFMDPERIEVLRGPQGTLYGMNTLGGAVNVITHTPTDKLSGYLDGTIGRFARKDIEGAISGALIPGKLKARFEGSMQKQDGYGAVLSYPSNAKIGQQGDINQQGGRVVFEWTPTDDLQVFLRADRARVRQSFDQLKLANVVTPPTASLITYNNIIGPALAYGPKFLTDTDFANYAYSSTYATNRMIMDNKGTSLTANLDRGSWSFKSITAYRTLRDEEDRDLDLSPDDLSQPDFHEHDHQFSQEFLVNGSPQARVQWIAGVNFLKDADVDENDSVSYGELAVLPNAAKLYPFAFYLALPSSVKTRSAGVFGQGTAKITDKLKLTAGLRYTDEQKDNSTSRTSLINGSIIVPKLSLTKNYVATTGRLALDYTVSDAVMAYASVSTGFKSGGINNAATTVTAFKSFEPEHVVTYEAGVRSEVAERRLRLNATIYYNDYTDLQFRTNVLNTPLLIYIIGNAGKARTYGFEFESDYVPTSHLTFGVDAGLINANYLQVDPMDGFPVNTVLPYVAKWTTHLFGEYRVTIPWGDLIGRLDGAYKSSMYFSQPNDPLAYQPAYWLLNARLSLLTGEHWETAVFGTNILDARYITQSVGTVVSLGFGYVGYGPPQEWGVEFRYTF